MSKIEKWKYKSNVAFETLLNYSESINSIVTLIGALNHQLKINEIVSQKITLSEYQVLVNRKVTKI